MYRGAEVTVLRLTCVFGVNMFFQENLLCRCIPKYFISLDWKMGVALSLTGKHVCFFNFDCPVGNDCSTSQGLEYVQIMHVSSEKVEVSNRIIIGKFAVHIR